MKSAGHDVHGCDIRGGMDCRETFKINDLKYDLVFHAASGEMPSRRLGTDADLIDWADRTAPGRLVYFSSEEVYPVAATQEPCRQSEADAVPDTAAGHALLAIENMVLDRGGMVFRPFQVYGEGGRGVFEQVGRRIAERPEPFRLDECGVVSDYVHVDDAIGTVLAAVAADYSGGPVNLCTGEPTARDELAEMMMQAVDWRPRQFFCGFPDRQSFLCGDPTAMAALRPPTIDLAEGIRRELAPTSISRPERPKNSHGRV